MYQEIQNSDYDRYISLIFSPKEKREDIAAIIHFNLEIARIKNRVTEPALGMVRYQWWREALDEVFDEIKEPRRHMAVVALKKAAEKYPGLNWADFLKIIDAREKDLLKKPFETTQQFDDYIDDTTYPLNHAMLHVLGVNNANILRATGHISQAYGLVAILRSAAGNITAHRIIFPLDMMNEHKLNPDNYGSETFLNNSKALVRHLIQQAENELMTAEVELKIIGRRTKKSAAPVLLFIEITRHYMNQIKNNDFDIFSKPIRPLGLLTLMKIYLKSLTGNF